MSHIYIPADSTRRDIFTIRCRRQKRRSQCATIYLTFRYIASAEPKRKNIFPSFLHKYSFCCFISKSLNKMKHLKKKYLLHTTQSYIYIFYMYIYIYIHIYKYFINIPLLHKMKIYINFYMEKHTAFKSVSSQASERSREADNAMCWKIQIQKGALK